MNSNQGLKIELHVAALAGLGIVHILSSVSMVISAFSHFQHEVSNLETSQWLLLCAHQWAAQFSAFIPNQEMFVKTVIAEVLRLGIKVRF